MDALTADELQEVRRPLASLLSKSEKARQKLAPGKWPHTMLGDNVRALRVALALMNEAPSGARSITRADLQDALRVLALLIVNAGQAQAKFLPGTSQHTLQRNRLRALRMAKSLVNAELAGSAPDAEPGAAADGAAR
jgi:hypothetical protein